MCSTLDLEDLGEMQVMRSLKIEGFRKTVSLRIARRGKAREIGKRRNENEFNRGEDLWSGLVVKGISSRLGQTRTDTACF